jgi:hypothetical protein
MKASRRRFLVAIGALAATSSGLEAAEVEGARQIFELALADGRLPAAKSTLRVTKGERVELRWTSDRRIALHLHGYDIEATVTPEAPRTMSFTANIAGRFPVSEHRRDAGHHRAVLYLEVHP